MQSAASCSTTANAARNSSPYGSSGLSSVGTSASSTAKRARIASRQLSNVLQPARQYRLDIGGAQRARIEAPAVLQRRNGFGGRRQAPVAGMDAVEPVLDLFAFDRSLRQGSACRVERGGRRLGDVDRWLDLPVWWAAPAGRSD